MKKTSCNNFKISEDVGMPGTARPEDIEHLSHNPFWITLWKFARPYRKTLLTAIICSMTVGVFVPLQMQFTVKWIIDSAMERSADSGELLAASERLRTSLSFVGLFIILSILRISVWTIGYRRMLASIEWILCQIRAHFFRHVQKMCFSFHDQISSGELFNYIMGTPINSIKQFLQQFSMMVPYQIVGWFLSIGLLASFNWQMTVITVAIILIVVYVNYRSNLIIREVASDFMQTESTASRYIADMLRGSRAIKTYTMEDSANKLFTHEIVKIRDQGFKLAMRQQIEAIKPEAIQFAGLASIMASGAFFVIQKGMTVGTFAAFVLSFNMLMQPIMAMLALNLVRANADTGLDRIMRVMQVSKTTPDPAPGDQIDPKRQSEKMRGKPEAGIKFENITFSYSNNITVLEECSCHIKNGESIALVGPSGSGKTTFISLLMRFYDPQKGRILMHGADIRSYDLRELRNQFGIVPQDPFIFQATLLDNIRVTNPESPEEDILSAMEAANMTEFVNNLPQGLDTWLGEGGSNLSGGQKQRLAIARALLNNPPNLIFDEATSALDNVSELKIQEALENLMHKHTTIVIAHRLSTIRNAHRIFVFERGRIVQDGTFDELAGKPGLFLKLLSSVEETGHIR